MKNFQGSTDGLPACRWQGGLLKENESKFKKRMICKFKMALHNVDDFF